MKLEGTQDGRYVIYREVGYRRIYFQMFVDHNKVSWSSFMEGSPHFATESDAFDVVIRIKDREKLWRKK